MAEAETVEEQAMASVAVCPVEQDCTSESSTPKGLRQLSYWFGEGATQRYPDAQVSDSNKQELAHESDAFDAMRAQEESFMSVVIVVDCTGSMGNYLVSLRSTLFQVQTIIKVLFREAEVLLYCYKDYSEKDAVFKKLVGAGEAKMHKFVEKLTPSGGMDIAEASKTALNEVLRDIERRKKVNASTILFHFTDAPPHHMSTNPSSMKNFIREQTQLRKCEPGFDWCDICRAFRALKNCHVHTIVPEGSPGATCGAAFYSLLGDLIVLESTRSPDITRVTMTILLQRIGLFEKEGAVEGAEHIPSIRVIKFEHEAAVFERLSSGLTETKMPELMCDASKLATFEPQVEHTDLIYIDGLHYTAILALRRDITVLPALFKRSEHFRDTVFSAMEILITPENVMALTYNSVVGRLWRMCCARREDKRLGPLTEAMSKCVSNPLFTENEVCRLKSWLEESYMNFDEIEEDISKAEKGCPKFFVLDAFETMPNVSALRSLARSPSPGVLKEVQQILSGLIVVRAGPDIILPVDSDGNKLYLPSTFDDYKIFTTLPHLMCPGTKFSLKPAALLAIICCKNEGSLLADRAARFLRSVRGKWLPPVQDIDRAEIISYEFSALLATCPLNEALTKTECEFFKRLHICWRYRRGRSTMFNVGIPFTPNVLRRTPDEKGLCTRCKNWTSLTLMTRSDICGLCLWELKDPKKNIWKRPAKGELYHCTKKESYMTECKCCMGIYAILGPADLGCKPVCHYCRGLDIGGRRAKGAPSRVCMLCKAKWIRPMSQCSMRDPGSSAASASSSGAASIEEDNFVCPVCANSSKPLKLGSPKGIHFAKISLQDLFAENPLLCTSLGFRIKAGKLLFSRFKMSKIVTEERQALFGAPREDVPLPTVMAFGKPVHDVEALIRDIQEVILSQSLVDSCSLCFEDFAVEQLHPACGHCLNHCCSACLRGWYTQNCPGGLFLPTHDSCPFCKRRPLYKVLTRYNTAACGLIGGSRKRGKQLQLRPDRYYGWCTACWKVQPAMNRACADGLPELRNFMCEDCVTGQQLRAAAEAAAAAAAAAAEYATISEVAALAEAASQDALRKFSKKCPGCGIWVSHAGGCSHMECQKCRTHFCWQCLKKFPDAGTTYEHLHSVHGGYMFVDDVPEEFDLGGVF